MSGKTVTVQVQVGAPLDIALCPRCLHACLCTLPLAGLTESGVVSMGTVTVCAECDLPQDVVRDYLAGGTNR